MLISFTSITWINILLGELEKGIKVSYVKIKKNYK